MAIPVRTKLEKVTLTAINLIGVQEVSANDRPLADTPAEKTADAGAVESRNVPARSRRWWSGAAWIAAGIVLLAFYARISDTGRIVSDGANSALQAWDLIHGHILLHGWVFGDATYTTLELPINGVMQLIFGLGPRATHVASALTYVIVAAFAVAVAGIGGSRPARVARGAAVVAMLSIPLMSLLSLWLLLEEPDHTGTPAFLLAAVLLIDRLADRRFTAPLVGVLLCVGEIGDATVEYVIVPAIVLACALRLLASRKLRSFDTAVGVAAAVSLPAEMLIRWVTVQLGGYVMVPPQAFLAAPSLMVKNVPLVVVNIYHVFGTDDTRSNVLGSFGNALGMLCLIATLAGLARVAWTWRRASRADQVIALAIPINIAVYLLSPLPQPSNYREVVGILPCGAVLAARTLIPATLGIARPQGSGLMAAFRRAWLAPVAVAVAILAALLPLSAAASRPSAGPAIGPAPFDGWGTPTEPLTAFLESHGYTYGLGSYWDSSIVTLQSGNKVAVRAIGFTREARGSRPSIPFWETNDLWYNPAQYDATFIVADLKIPTSTPHVYESVFGKPVATYQVDRWEILDYHRNLLSQVLQPLSGQSSGPRKRAHRWWGGWGSNPRPADYESAALTC